MPPLPAGARTGAQSGGSGGDADRPTSGLLFVGERRSRRAIALGATWERGGQCATTLRAALVACGIEPTNATFRNLFEELGADDRPGGDEPPLAVDRAALAAVRAGQAAGVTIVALGRRVEATLRRAGIPCRYLIHPAARGRVRDRATYRALVAAVIAPPPERRP